MLLHEFYINPHFTSSIWTFFHGSTQKLLFLLSCCLHVESSTSIGSWLDLHFYWVRAAGELNLSRLERDRLHITEKKQRHTHHRAFNQRRPEAPSVWITSYTHPPTTTHTHTHTPLSTQPDRSVWGQPGLWGHDGHAWNHRLYYTDNSSAYYTAHYTMYYTAYYGPIRSRTMTPDYFLFLFCQAENSMSKEIPQSVPEVFFLHTI